MLGKCERLDTNFAGATRPLGLRKDPISSGITKPGDYGTILLKGSTLQQSHWENRSTALLPREAIG